MFQMPKSKTVGCGRQAFGLDSVGNFLSHERALRLLACFEELCGWGMFGG